MTTGCRKRGVTFIEQETKKRKICMLKLTLVFLATISVGSMMPARAQNSTNPNTAPTESLKPSTTYSEEELERMVPPLVQKTLLLQRRL
jgi:hypothetical protein